MLASDAGSVTDARLEQLENANAPIDVIPSSNVTFVSAVHQQKARSSISRTVEGMRTLRSFWHARNAASLIFRTGRPSMYAGMTRSPS